MKKARGTSREYPVSGVPKLRTESSFKKNAEEAQEQRKTSCGVKFSSVLFLLAYFTFPCHFVVDYLHALCSSSVKSATMMWFKHKGRHSYDLGKHMSEADTRLHAFPPV